MAFTFPLTLQIYKKSLKKTNYFAKKRFKKQNLK